MGRKDGTPQMMYPRSFVVSLLIVALLAGLLPVAAAAPQATSMYQVYVTDVNDRKFVVTWTTDAPTTGTVEWGTSASTPFPNSTSDAVASTVCHRVVISGLRPDTDYYFQVKSGSMTDDNNGDFFKVTTSSMASLPTPGPVLWGYVYEQNGTTPVPNAIVYLQLQDNGGGGDTGNSPWVTARTNASGFWSYALANMRKADGSGFFDFQGGTDKLRIVRQGGDKGVTGEDDLPRVLTVPTSHGEHFDQAGEVLDAMPLGSPIVGEGVDDGL